MTTQPEQVLENNLVKQLQDLGHNIKESSSIEINGSDLKVGFSNFTHSYEQIKKALESHYFKNKHLKAIGKTEWDTMRWTGIIKNKGPKTSSVSITVPCYDVNGAKVGDAYAIVGSIDAKGEWNFNATLTTGKKAKISKCDLGKAIVGGF